MANPYFSVVMPVYGVEKYLEKTVKSVISQTFQDFELILVDDCSKDGSGKICDDFAARDSRVKTVHLSENGGASNARNSGTLKATGTYLYYMDSDDTIDSDIFEKLYESSKELLPDVVMFGAVEEYIDKIGKLYMSNPILYPEKVITDKTEVIKEVISVEETTLFGYLWNKIYLKKTVDSSKVVFADMPLNEDFKFNIDFFRFVNSFVTLPYAAYHYAKRENQSLTCRFVKNYFDLQTMRSDEILNFYREYDLCDENVLRYLGNAYVRSVFSALQQNNDKRADMSGKQRKQWLKSQYESELYKEVLPYADPESTLAKKMASMLKSGKTRTLLFAGRFISFVKNSFPALFAGLKLKK